MIKTQHTTTSNTAGRIAMLEPRTPDELHRFVRVAMGMVVPRVPLISGNSAPFDYLMHAYFEEPSTQCESAGKDAVIWANRGGGKTMLGAVATLLDLLFKPGIQIRVLGGSLEQSSKMHEHLVQLLDRPWFHCLLDGEPSQRRVALINGSKAQLLAGSQRSVRGVRVHKLRCDEVEEFDPAVWEAAQMVTRSGNCGGKHVHGTVEALSTMHRPFGLMSKIARAHETGESDTFRLFKWSAIDVIERCPMPRPCEGCELWEDCRGLAKQANGFIPVDDLVRQWRRTSRRTWSAEMMCREPEVSDCVYPEFDTAGHVRETVPETDRGVWIGGMDFGLRSPTVMLWAQVAPPDAASREHVIHVMDEYIQAGMTFGQHINAIESQAALHGRPRVDWLGVDPAGNQRNSHTGISDVNALRRMGYKVKSQRSSLRDSIERVRRRLDRHTLCIHPRCQRLIEAMRCYHFDTEHTQRQDPVKDGPDHLCDALRYMIVNLETGPGRLTATSYL
jgi:Terminase RNaseH-like domain